MQKTPPFLVASVLAALAALAPFAIDTYLPAFHTMAQALGADNLQIQQSLTAYLLAYAAMTLWHGAISDAIGRLPTIYWGLGVFALASLGCTFATNVETLWFFRAVQGISAGASNVVARAMVRDLFEGVAAQRVMAQLQMMFGIAPAIAPIIGGWLLGIHWQAIFVFLFVYAMLSIVVVRSILRETLPSESRVPLSAKQVVTGYRQIFGDMEYVRLVVAIGANFSGFFIYVLSAPVFLIEHLGLSPQQFAWMFIPTVFGTILGSFFARYTAGKFASHKVLRFGYLWMALSVLFNVTVCLFPPHAFWNIAPIALYNIGMAFVMPVLSIAALDCVPRLRGTAASGQAFMQMVLSTASAGLIIPLLWHHPLGLAMGMAGYLLIGWLSLRSSAIWQPVKGNVQV
ncbi:Bcr/CflA family drug resistance efflux transporter [Methylovorus sp. MM2]|uniref:multidrug effflux MFS transporter n=1 Tax=Methylovorus sp. MM2 TaxID=1848038 RepID=UPI0007E0F0C5|nr:multidrug effflux MFS transporter [Methylovorus sp. MM2]OAM52860.1 Bcr/CflA family drug resistance efflux transporter [Methylovorus sp. MM2]